MLLALMIGTIAVCFVVPCNGASAAHLCTVLADKVGGAEGPAARAAPANEGGAVDAATETVSTLAVE